MRKHTLANRSPSPESQAVKVNSAGQGPSPHYRHLTSTPTSRHPHCSQLSGPQGQTRHWPYTLRPESLPVGLQPYFSLWSPSQDAVGCMSRWRKASLQLPASLLSPVPGTCWMDISPQTTPSSSSSLTVSSYFTSHMWETPPCLTQSPHLPQNKTEN